MLSTDNNPTDDTIDVYSTLLIMLVADDNSTDVLPTLLIVPMVSTDDNPTDVYLTDGTNINLTNSTNGIN